MLNASKVQRPRSKVQRVSKNEIGNWTVYYHPSLDGRGTQGEGDNTPLSSPAVQSFSITAGFLSPSALLRTLS